MNLPLPDQTSANPSRDDFFLLDVLDHARALVLTSRDAVALFDEECADQEARARAIRWALNDALEQLDELRHVLHLLHTWKPSECEIDDFLAEQEGA
jgi:hypothetical protein